ncbi:hypothetical protein SynBIOSE41_02108 [Synechococcus sp. BIOS-E4-1]|nr:hypothetical protein SynBIOSE41_02108 [Synechococcus sp. BIOS-E4-1]
MNIWVIAPIDSLKIAAFLVNPTAQHWCRRQEILVIIW